MKIDQFDYQLTKVTSIKEAEVFLSYYLQQFHFSRFAFTYYSKHIKSGRKLVYDFVSEALRPWHKHYLEQGYADVDRTLEESFLTTQMVLWDVQEQLKIAKNNREIRIRQESIEFGIDKGLSIPVYGPHHDFASLTLHQFCGENNLQHIDSEKFNWMIAAQIFYFTIKKFLTHEKNHQRELTKREKQCLSLTAKSWRVEQIAQELKISIRTVNFHIQNANKKLGFNNKYQSAYEYLHGI